MIESNLDHPYIIALFDRARKVYGERHQMKKCAEECCELSTAILRYTNGCDGHTAIQCFDNILEETADVAIMVDQLCRILSDETDSTGRTLADLIVEKLVRLEQRLDIAEGKSNAEA